MFASLSHHRLPRSGSRGRDFSGATDGAVVQRTESDCPFVVRQVLPARAQLPRRIRHRTSVTDCARFARIDWRTHDVFRSADSN